MHWGKGSRYAEVRCRGSVARSVAAGFDLKGPVESVYCTATAAVCAVAVTAVCAVAVTVTVFPLPAQGQCAGLYLLVQSTVPARLKCPTY